MARGYGEYRQNPVGIADLCKLALRVFLFILLAFAFSLRAPAQSLTNNWFTIAGGGGTSTNSTLTVSGTIGQPAAGKQSGGNLSLSGGFWSIIAASVTPSITTQPLNRTVTAGQSATFTVTASGTAPLSYQWRFNGSDLPGATTNSYTRINAQTNDAGTYLVVVANSAGSVTSAPRTLTVMFSLAVTATVGGVVGKSPDQSSYLPNASVTLTATADPCYVFMGWSGDGSGTNNPLNVTMTTNKIISATFSNTMLADIILDNPDPEVTLLGPWATGNLAGRYGVDYLFSSTTVGGTATATYRPNITTPGYYDVYIWYLDGPNRAFNAPWRVVYDGGSTNVLVDQTTNGAQWLRIAASRPFQQGTSGYVRLSNGTGSSGSVVIADAVQFCLVAPSGSPFITVQPQNHLVAPGQAATFSVTAGGTAPLSYQWRSSFTDIPGATASSYTLTTPTDEHPDPLRAGYYSVVVTNSSGSVTSAFATLSFGHFFPSSLLPPPDGVYVSSVSQPIAQQYGSQFLTRNVKLSRFTGGQPPPPPGGSQTHSFDLQADFEWSDNGGSTFTPRTAPGQCTFSVTDTGPPGTERDYQTEMLQLNLSGGNLPGGVQFRESPTLPSTGQTWLEPTSYGGYIINSFFDVFTELTIDGGQSWTPSTGSMHVDLESLPPWISVQPQSQAVGQGSNATFTVTAFGALPLSYQWRFNGAPIGGATTNTYTRSNVQPADAGSYSVVVTNLFGSVTSTLATLTMLVPVSPATLSSPLFLGNSSFQCLVTGTTGVNYVVQFSTNVAPANWISLSTNPAPFTFQDTQASNSATRFYRAVYWP